MMYFQKKYKFFLIAITLSTFMLLGLTACGGGYSNYAIGGNVNGFSDGMLTLALHANGVSEETLSLEGGSSSFTFQNRLNNHTTYEVKVTQQPGNLYCQVNQGTGTISSVDISNIVVDCLPEQFVIGGTLSGLQTGDTITLQNNSLDDLTLSTNGLFIFSKEVGYGQDYEVTVTKTTGSNHYNCQLANHNGMAFNEVTNIQVVCSVTVTQ